MINCAMLAGELMPLPPQMIGRIWPQNGQKTADRTVTSETGEKTEQ